MVNNIRIELELPNIFMEFPEDRYDPSVPVSYKHEALFKTFMVQVAKEFPQWTFVQEYSYYVVRESINPITGSKDTTYCMDSFKVYDKDEQIGELSSRYNRRAPCIHIRNNRIYNDIERGSGRETKDIAKAIRLTKKYFGAKTLEESVKGAMSEVHRAVSYTHNDKAGIFQRKYKHLCNHLMDYMMENIDTLLEVAERAGADPNNVRSITEAWNEQKITGDIEQCYANEKGVVVYLHGQNYAVTKPDGALRIYTADDAPDILKRKLGLLKLVEDGQCITDAGLRVNEQIYFVMEELF